MRTLPIATVGFWASDIDQGTHGLGIGTYGYWVLRYVIWSETVGAARTEIYSDKSALYKLPIFTTSESQISAAEEQRQVFILDSQLEGTIRGHSGGHGILEEPTFTQSISDGVVTITATPIRAFIDQVYGYESSLSWEVDVSAKRYLFIQRTEESRTSADYKSSVEYGNFIAVSNGSGEVPKNGLLIATREPGADFTPAFYTPNLLVLLSDHIADNTDPHGEIWRQTDLATSGLVALEDTTVLRDMTILGIANFGSFVLTGVTELIGATVNGNLVVSGLAQFAQAQLGPDVDIDLPGNLRNVTVVSGLDAENIYFGSNVGVSENVLIDGRDISADGAVLGNHVGNYLNPHQVTADQLDIICLAGDNLLGNVSMASGLSVDGIDFSTLQNLIDGTEFDVTNQPHIHADGQWHDQHGGVTIGNDHPQYLHVQGLNILTGNQPVASGIGVDGIDFSVLQPLIDGSLVDHLHRHSRVRAENYIFNAPEYAGQITSGTEPGELRFGNDGTHNYAKWTGADQPATINILVPLFVPSGHTGWQHLYLYNKVDHNSCKIQARIFDTAGNTQEVDYNNRTFRNTSWTFTDLLHPEAPQGQEEDDPGSPAAGAYTDGEEFLLSINMTCPSGISAHVGELVGVWD